MPKLLFTLTAMVWLLAITSCKNVNVDPDPENKPDTTTKVDSKGWAELKAYPGTALRWTFGFSANNKGYVMGGQYETTGSSAANVFQYDPLTDKWSQLGDYPGKGMGLMAGFTLNNKVYIGTGFNYATEQLQADFWEYDASTDSWIQKADFPGGKRQGALSFSINDSGYLLGALSKTIQDLWKYNAATDQWTRMADYPGAGIAEMIGATAGGKAYVGAGSGMEEVVSDFWEYDPAGDKWTKKADIIEPLYNPVTFTRGTKIFVIGGIAHDLKFRKGVLVYDTATDQWTKLDDFAGQERAQAVGFVIGDTAYFGLGSGSKWAGGATYPVYLNDFWKYNP